MKENYGGEYLIEMVGCPFDDGANVISNFLNKAHPSLVIPKRDMNLVPNEELSL